MPKHGRRRSSNSTKLIENSINTNKETLLNKLESTDESFEDFIDLLYKYIDYDVQMIRDCPEKAICEIYVEMLDDIAESNTLESSEKFMNILRECVRTKLANIYAPDITFDDTIDKYFNDVKREYILHPMGESELYEMTDENRDLYVKNNLKTVIECAKRYRGLGVDFEDLIQIGNLGLLKAWNKFDVSKSELQNNIIKAINESYNDTFSNDDARTIIISNFRYSKLLQQTLDKLPDDGFHDKESFVDWARTNIKKASFASLGFIWARAAITSELNGLSNIIRIPKSIKESDDKVTFINLDSLNPHTDDNFSDDELYDVANELFCESDDNIENMERNDMFKKILDDVFMKMNGRNRRIIMKRFGINLPFPLSIADISENEGISQREVKSIIEKSLQFIQENISEENKKILFEIL